MKSILLKLDDKLFAETEERVKAEKTSRSNYIKQAIEQYNKWQRKKAIEAQLEREVELIKHDAESWKEFKEMEEASLTDLNKLLDNLEKK